MGASGALPVVESSDNTTGNEGAAGGAALATAGPSLAGVCVGVCVFVLCVLCVCGGGEMCIVFVDGIYLLAC